MLYEHYTPGVDRVSNRGWTPLFFYCIVLYILILGHSLRIFLPDLLHISFVSPLSLFRIFSVSPFFAIKNLSTDTYFNSLTEYLEMSNFLQKKAHANSQIQLMWVKDNTLYGNCEKSQLKGEFPKSFCFRFLSAIFAGGNDFKYNIDGVLNKLDRIDNQFGNLKNFVEYANASILKPTGLITPSDDDIIEGDDDIQDIDNIHRVPDRGVDPTGRKRFKTQRKIRDSVLEKAHYMCDCDDAKHFYFESVDLHNYVEGHHIVPMNRQEEYY